jgi:putative spermidine/putrescine transport system substrate-binding protein
MVATAAIALAGTAQARDLTVVSWGGAYQDAQKQVYFEPYKAESGKPLLEESWDGGIGVLRAQVEGGNATWDIVQVEAEELAIGCDEGILEELDFSKLGGKERYLTQAVHPCGIGAIVWSFILGYDRDKLTEAPQGWADFFDTAKYPGKRGLRQGPKGTLEMALIGDGVPLADVYSVLGTDEGVERAFKKLDTIKDDIVWWTSGAQPPQLLAAGEVVMTSVYNGRIDAANKNDGRNFGVVWPGSLYTLDSWVILKGSPNAEQAYELIEFMGRAEHQAKLPLAIAYGVTNPEANASIPPERLADLPTAEENLSVALQISDSFWIENIDRLTERFNAWAGTN